jgi:hypothetical protein
MSKNQGIQSRNKVAVGQRLGTGANRVHVAATNQRLGSKVGDHATNKGNTGYVGETLYNRSAPTFDPVRYGNEVAASTVCGVGGSRTIHSTGGQGRHGEVSGSRGNPAPRSGDVMSNRR